MEYLLDTNILSEVMKPAPACALLIGWNDTINR